MCNKTDDDNDDDDEFCRRAKKRMGRFANDTTLFTNELHILRVRKQELSYCRGWPTVREQLKRLCLHRRCVEYLAIGNFYLLA